MSIAVGRRIGQNDPSLEGYENILCLTESTPYGSLSPYVLKHPIELSDGSIVMANLENIWQFSKLYSSIPYSRQIKSRYQPYVIWEHPEEIHVNNNYLTSNYWLWRDKGFKNQYPVRYPVGYDYRHKCIYSVLKDPLTKQYKFLDYISARREIYLPNYLNSLDPYLAETGKKKLNYLKQKISRGNNLLIIEIDGPHFESLQYYQEKYNVGNDFILPNNVSVINSSKLEIFLNDPKHPFGHGYCLAWKLLNS